MTLHPIPSEHAYIYEENFVFFLINVVLNSCAEDALARDGDNKCRACKLDVFYEKMVTF
jgi:hypothetical protein